MFRIGIPLQAVCRDKSRYYTARKTCRLFEKSDTVCEFIVFIF